MSAWEIVSPVSHLFRTNHAWTHTPVSVLVVRLK